jgi:mannosyltransferase OCH1-like enzyme
MLIPKILHRIWLGVRERPAEFEEYWATWNANHPGWELRTWLDKDVVDFGRLKNQNEYDHAALLGTRKELFCFEMLYALGGVYVDCDFESYKCLKPLIENVTAFAGGYNIDEVNTAILGCTPGNEDMAILIDGIPESFQSPGNSDVGLAGPVYLKRMVPKLKDFTVFDRKYLYPYSWPAECLGPSEYTEAYAVHHWAGQWSKVDGS